MTDQPFSLQRFSFAVFCLVFLGAAAVAAAAGRFVIDDDEYLDKICASCSNLLQKGQLKPLPVLRSQVDHLAADSPRRDLRRAIRTVTNAPHADQKLAPTELCERLRQSTLAVGSFYKCPDCGEFHFNSSTGFIISADGIICTCGHVVMEEDEGVKESYLAAADADGRVYPVQAVIAADTEADTCFLKIEAQGFKPLALRAEVRQGERIYCLSHPGGNHFMFTEGLVARLNKRWDEGLDHASKTNRVATSTRPILYVNVTAEFAPGSSGAPIVDEAGNVVAQVSSIAESGDPAVGDDNTAPSPSVPIRFCLAAEEILRLTKSRHDEPVAAAPRTGSQRFAHHVPTNQPARVK